MIECNKCGGACKDDALYCEHCGNRLDTKACRKCGFYVPEEAKYCSKCGYPTSGNVCSRCGKISPDESAFCSGCGNKLGKVAPATAPVAAKFTAANSDVATASATVKQPKQSSGIGMKIYGLTRVFVLPALLMCMFIFSFFGNFTMDIVSNVTGDSNGFKMDTTEASVTGFDAVRGMFLIIDPPTAEEVSSDFEKFVAKGKYTDYESAVRDFGVLKLQIFEGSVTANKVMQILVWGLHSLSLMILTLIFFILSLVHAVKYVRGEKQGFYKHEAMSLALPLALTFGFVVMGGMLGGAAITNLILAAAGLSGITACKYFMEKAQRPTIAVNIRRGVCAALVVLVMCFAGSALVGVGYGKTFIDGDSDILEVYPDITVSIPSGDLYVGMTDPVKNIEDMGITNETEQFTSANLDGFIAAIFAKEFEDYFDVSKNTKEFLLRILGNPILLCNTLEAVHAYGAGGTALSWLLFIANLFTLFATVMLLYKMFMEEAEPEKTHKTGRWFVLAFAGVMAILATAVIFTIIGNVISSQLGMGLGYSIGVLPIVTAVLALAALIVDAVIKKVCAKKQNALNSVEPTAQQQTIAE